MPDIPAVLEITDGTTTVNLLDRRGIHLYSWRQNVLAYKGGGVFRDSPLSDGRQPVLARQTTLIDEFNIKIRGVNPDGTIIKWRELGQLLGKAVQYWTARWQSEPVWIEAQSTCETQKRYALITMWRVPELGNPFAQPFLQGGLAALLDEVHLFLEHLPWQNQAPGTVEDENCVEISAFQRWEHEGWISSSALPTQAVRSIIEADCGYLVAGDRDNAWLTATGASGSWAASGGFGANNPEIRGMVQIPDGTIHAAMYVTGTAAGKTMQSADCGLTWADSDASVGTDAETHAIDFNADLSALGYADPLVMVGGTLLNGEANPGVWTGLPWTQRINTAIWTSTDCVYYPPRWPSGYLLGGRVPTIPQPYTYFSVTSIFTSMYHIYRWYRRAAAAESVWIGTVGPVECIFQTSARHDGILLAGCNGQILGSWSGEKNTWASQTTAPVGQVYDIWEDPEGFVYAAENQVVWRSQDLTTWESISVAGGQLYSGAHFTVSAQNYAGEDGDIYQSGDVRDMGRTATCENEVYFSNKHTQFNLTHIKIEDNSLASFTDAYPMTATYNLFPSPPAVNDAIYFGIDSALQADDPPFDSLVFDIGNELVPGAGMTMIWEYYNGAWGALTVVDHTNSGGIAFDTPGVNSVHWEPPSDWTAFAVDGITALWVRCRINAIGAGATQEATQQTRNPYTIIWPYIDVDADQVGGDISALLRARVYNQGEASGGAAPYFWMNRVMVGLRSLDRGPDFTAYLNCSDVQNIPAITVTDQTNTADTTNIQSPTGRTLLYTPIAAPEALATRAWIDIGASVARDFYGTFHVYVRVTQTSGAAGDFSVRIAFATGAGGIWAITRLAETTHLREFEVLDLGQVSLPATGEMTLDDLPDRFRMYLQAQFDGGATGPTLEFFDVILMPVDEWAANLVDLEVNISSSINYGGLLEIDSIIHPKREIRALKRRVATDYVVANWDTRANGPAILQHHADQRLWFFCTKQYAVDDDDELGTPWLGNSAQLWALQRYLAMRGAD